MAGRREDRECARHLGKSSGGDFPGAQLDPDCSRRLVGGPIGGADGHGPSQHGVWAPHFRTGLEPGSCSGLWYPHRPAQNRDLQPVRPILLVWLEWSKCPGSDRATRLLRLVPNLM